MKLAQDSHPNPTTTFLNGSTRTRHARRYRKQWKKFILFFRSSSSSYSFSCCVQLERRATNTTYKAYYCSLNLFSSCTHIAHACRMCNLCIHYTTTQRSNAHHIYSVYVFFCFYFILFHYDLTASRPLPLPSHHSKEFKCPSGRLCNAYSVHCARTVCTHNYVECSFFFRLFHSFHQLVPFTFDLEVDIGLTLVARRSLTDGSMCGEIRSRETHTHTHTERKRYSNHKSSIVTDCKIIRLSASFCAPNKINK